MTKDELIHFESNVKVLWEQGKIRVPVHFSGGNEDKLLEIFGGIRHDDWVISTHRCHYHALLHGVNPVELLSSIMGLKPGGSMVHAYRTPPFISTGIVAGGCGIAVGIAWAVRDTGKKVWCFVGDGATDEGHFYEAWRYAVGYNLPLTFIIEDNDRATCTSNEERWGQEGVTRKIWDGAPKVIYYKYTPTYPHVGTGKYVQF